MQADQPQALETTQPVHLVIVPHTHWDREWYQPFQEFRGRLVRLSERLLDILERDPTFAHFHFDGQTIVLEDYLEIRPDRRAQLGRLIREGRIAVGPWYVLPDEFLVSGESLIRNLQIGHRLAAEFGAPAKIGYLPDEFGHTAQMPQILAGFGIDCAVVWRGVGANVTQTLFWWEGLDGTATFTVYLPLSGYSNGRNLPESAEELRRHLGTVIAEQAPFRRIPSLLVMNGTDHQEPQAQLPATLAAAAHGLEGVTYEIAPLARFIERARREHQALETHHGELRSSLRTTVIPGVTSVRVRLKQRDFENVSRLERYAEPLATWADLVDLPSTPASLGRGNGAGASAKKGRTSGRQYGYLTDWAWKLAVQNHPHDSITGCSVDQVHRDMESRFDQVQLVVNQVIGHAFRALVERLDTASVMPDTAVVVYNPNCTGPNLVSADLNLDASQAYVLIDAGGREVPLHVEAGASEVLLDAELPPADVRPHVLAMQSREFLGMVVNDIRLDRRGATLTAAVTLDRMQRGHLDLPRLRAEWLAHLDDPALRSVVVHAQTGVPARGTFYAPDLTGNGFSVFRLQRTNATVPSRAAPAAGEREIENEFFCVGVNDDGTLHVADKQIGLVLPRCNWFVDEGDRGDEYNFDSLSGQAVTAPCAPPTIAIDAGNAVAQTLTVTQHYELPRCLEADRERRSPARVLVPFTTVVRLHAGIRRVDFETTVDNAVADHRLRVHFQTPLVVDSAFMEQAFGTVERSLMLEPPSEFEQPSGAGPQRTFTCIEDGTHGVAVFNRGTPEIEVRRIETGTELALSLIRAVGWLSRGDLRSRHGPAGPGLETPEAQSPGLHRFTYALTTYAGNWQTAGIVAQAHAFAYPPLAAMTDPHPGTISAGAALVHCNNSSVVLSALAASTSAWTGAFVARWYNSSSEPQTAEITAPLAVRLRAVNLLEQSTRAAVRRIAPQRWRVRFRPFEIVTLQIRTR